MFHIYAIFCFQINFYSSNILFTHAFVVGRINSIMSYKDINFFNLILNYIQKLKRIELLYFTFLIHSVR